MQLKIERAEHHDLKRITFVYDSIVVGSSFTRDSNMLKYYSLDRQKVWFTNIFHSIHFEFKIYHGDLKSGDLILDV